MVVIMISREKILNTCMVLLDGPIQATKTSLGEGGKESEGRVFKPMISFFGFF